MKCTTIRRKKGKPFENFGLRREYCPSDWKNCSNYGGFPITEIRIIESKVKGFLKEN